MLEEILDIRNVQKAFKQVTANKGAGGIDGMQTDELRDYLNTNWQMLRTSRLLPPPTSEESRNRQRKRRR